MPVWGEPKPTAYELDIQNLLRTGKKSYAPDPKPVKPVKKTRSSKTSLKK